MDHTEAQQSQAVARYILNEMSDDERDRFEEHYFDCRDCGADVLAGERLMANGRALMREIPAVLPVVPRRSWKAWILPAAAALLLPINALFLISGRSAVVSQIVAVTELPFGVNRSANEPTKTLRAGVPNLLFVEVPPESVDAYPRFELRFRNADKVVAREQVSKKEAEEGVYWLLSSLPAGSYVLAIHGVPEDGNLPVIVNREVRVR